jgi:hypothetical protein
MVLLGVWQQSLLGKASTTIATIFFWYTNLTQKGVGTQLHQNQCVSYLDLKINGHA